MPLSRHPIPTVPASASIHSGRPIRPRLMTSEQSCRTSHNTRRPARRQPRNDAFNMACTQAAYRDNCPDPPGPDLDFGMAPMLVTRPDGKDIPVAGQKSGVVWALDPDDDGALLWSTAVGKGSTLGGVHWGMASDGRYAYAPVSDRAAVIVDVNPGRELSPGLHALDLMTGEVVCRSVPPPQRMRGEEGLLLLQLSRRDGDRRRCLRKGTRRCDPGTFDRGRGRDLAVRHDTSGRDGRGCAGRGRRD